MGLWSLNSILRPTPQDDAEQRRKLGVKLTKLMRLYEPKDKERILNLIKSGADVNIRGPEDFTPLICAAAKNDRDIFMALIMAGADVSCTTTHGDTALMWLPHKSDDVVMAEALLQRDPSLLSHLKKNNWGALHLAAYFGRAALTQYLLDKGADYKQTNNDQMTPHGVALKNGHLEVAALIERRERADATPKFGDYVVVDDMNVKTSIGDGLTVTFNFLTQQALYRDPMKPDAVVAVSAFDTFPNKSLIKDAHAALIVKCPQTLAPAPFVCGKKMGIILS
ncbi:MAG: ankyrin repeat domain-containing protein [Bdellovibrionales bacterium]